MKKIMYVSLLALAACGNQQSAQSVDGNKVAHCTQLKINHNRITNHFFLPLAKKCADWNSIETLINDFDTTYSNGPEFNCTFTMANSLSLKDDTVQFDKNALKQKVTTWKGTVSNYKTKLGCP